MKKFFTSNNFTGWIFVLPVLLLIAAFVIFPVFESIRISFFRWDGYSDPKFIGLKNYIDMFTKDIDFRIAMKNTFIFQWGITAGEILVGLLLAVVIDLKVKFWRIYRVIYFLPFVLSVFIVVSIWGKVFQHDGLLNDILRALHLENLQQYWLLSPGMSIPIMIFIMVWQLASWPMIFFLAGLQNIDEDIYEAAELDGATTFQRITKISLPLIKHVISIVTVMLLIFNFRTFVLVFLLTRGGPSGATEVFGTLIYKYAFTLERFGYSSVISVISIAFALVLAVIYYKVSGYKNNE